MQDIIINSVALIAIALAVYFCIFHRSAAQSPNSDWSVEQDDAVEAYLSARDKLNNMLDIHGVEYIVAQLAHVDAEVS